MANAYFRTGVIRQDKIAVQLQQRIPSDSADRVIVTWSTNTIGLTLQSSTGMASTSIWTQVSPGPVIVGGLNTVTNVISGPQHFYRLGG